MKQRQRFEPPQARSFRRRAVPIALASALAAVAAGAGVSSGSLGAGAGTTEPTGSAPSGSAPTGSVPQFEAPTFAYTSPTQPTFVIRDYGLFEYGPQFGFTMTDDNVNVFDSHAVAAQTVLSGESDILAGSITSAMLLVEQGQEFRTFCPFIKNDDFVLVARGGVTDMAGIFDDSVSVGVDSPGGAGDIILNGMIRASGDERTTADLPNTQLIESSGLRTTAFVADEVQATIVHQTQFDDEIAPNVEDAVIISRLWEDVPVFMKEVFAAPVEWIDENLDLAAAVCATMITSARELAASEERFIEVVTEYIDEPPPAETLSVIWPIISNDTFWPLETGITEDDITFMGELAVASGLIEEVPAYEDIVDPRPFEMALELVGAAG